ncbi:hypothetical protein ACXR2U_00465 [Jatrophihabitans sp. YIM 134969]
MTTYTESDRRALSDEQIQVLAALEGDLGHEVDRLLRERGIPVRVSSIQFVPTAAASSSDDGTAGAEFDEPPTKMPPPGGVYICWQEVEGGPWICVCGAPEVLSSGG